jgi:hypothetical protein
MLQEFPAQQRVHKVESNLFSSSLGVQTASAQEGEQMMMMMAMIIKNNNNCRFCGDESEGSRQILR